MTQLTKPVAFTRLPQCPTQPSIDHQRSQKTSNLASLELGTVGIYTTLEDDPIDSRFPGVRTCAVLPSPPFIWAFTSTPLPLRCPIEHRMLFVVPCIHICAVLQKDPSKFHMSLEPAQVLLEHSADMEAWDDNDKRTPLSVLTPFSDTAPIQKHGSNMMRALASTLRRIRQRVRKTISLQREIN